MRLFLAIVIIVVLGCSAPPEVKSPVVKAIEKEEVQKTPEPASETKAKPDYDTTLWTDIKNLLPQAKLDIRYATTNNFVKEQLYECPRCWLRPDAAKALVNVAADLKKEGYGIVLFDCYRPRPVQQKLWDIMPNAAYVTPPERGSMHNRGKAVDLSITDKKGNQLDMGTPYDFFGRPAHVDYRDHPKEILERRDLLKAIMEKNGFSGIRTEWWHFSYGGKKTELSDELWKCR